MSVEPIGVFTLVLGFYALSLGSAFTAALLVIMSIFGSAAALVVGSASVPPAHLFLLFLVISIVSGRTDLRPATAMLSVGKPGFWLAALVTYGAISAYFLPRLLSGETLIVPLGISEYPLTRGVVPLGPVSSNFTQPIYLLADFVCFVAISVIGSTSAGCRAIVNALIAYAALNIGFALLDLATAATGTQDALQFMRNAQYTFHENESVNGMKRIVGSWPEASAFAGTTLGVLGFTGTLWLCGRTSRWQGFLAVASLLLIMLSTSSTGLVATPVCLAIMYCTALSKCGTSQASGNATAFVLLSPLLLVVATLVVILSNDLYGMLYEYVDILVLSKATSNSGIARGAWNSFGMQNFWDSSGFGVGLGTARTSSFPIAVLSNVGVPGAIFFATFAIAALTRMGNSPQTFERDVKLAARNGCLCLLVGGTVAGATVDLGLLFFILAGLAASRPVPSVEAAAPFLRLRQQSDGPAWVARNDHTLP
ncbi:hypothetical protein QTL95_04580 [Rhizobium sp. S152]|uniref:hypothetical protein n=1 Tax=Rhizobium sp. S152 TaxID=3055038 RepID=UPI0025A9703E|nr:hypothetical protein [Rhizobium sp. S152]MDM9625162.1 hypothetical protein [Rhizobium sp. S152]